MRNLRDVALLVGVESVIDLFTYIYFIDSQHKIWYNLKKNIPKVH